MESSEYRQSNAQNSACYCLEQCRWNIQTSEGTSENLPHTVHFNKRHYLSIFEQSQGKWIANMTTNSKAPTKSQFYVLIKVIVTIIILYSLPFHLWDKRRYHYGCAQECDIQIYFDVSLLSVLSFLLRKSHIYISSPMSGIQSSALISVNCMCPHIRWDLCLNLQSS